MKKIVSNLKNSSNGLKLAWDDLSFRIAVMQVAAGMVLATALAFILNINIYVWLALVLSLIPIIIVELINTAIEAVTDKASPERHPLAKKAKDIGSAAVLLTRVMAATCWFIIIMNSWVTD